MTDEEFFTATDELTTIHQWARARYAAPWAVFGAVLLRVAATTEPAVQLPGVIGGRASLNLLAAFVAPSGGGKGISDKVARLAWPTEIEERPLGSGEGLSAIFARPKPKKDDDEPEPGITRAIISVPEIDTLAGLASRQGSILLAQLKSLAMGETIGQSNASAATTRIVQAHTYRACLSVGAQPGHTGVIFDDATGGTPQRFLWFLTVDPDMPADLIDDPEPLNHRLPTWAWSTTGVTEITYGPSEIRETIIAAHLARQRGEADALDGHAMLTRCKVAAVLAIMHHRSVVSDLDWQLSAVVMDRSDTVRNWLVDESKKAARKKVRDRATARAVGEETVSNYKLDRAKKAVVRWLDRNGEMASNKIRSCLKADLRDYCGAALAELVVAGQIEEISVERGTRYRLAESTGCTEVQGEYSQVREGVPAVQGVPGPQLHAVPQEPLTATQWLDDHVAALLADGIDTAESKTVYDAGVAAGFKVDALRQAARKSDQIGILERRQHTTIWRLGAGGENRAVTAEQWLTGWLSTRGWVKAADAYEAGSAAGYGRTAIKSAANRAAVAKRGESVSTEWSASATEEIA